MFLHIFSYRFKCLIRDKQAKFVTAYVEDSGKTATEIRKSPKWAKK